jgi:NAD+ diphosphatase
MAPPRTGPAFSGATVDRVATQRHDPAWIGRQLADPASRAVAATRDGVLVDPDDVALSRLAPHRNGDGDEQDEPILLGLEDGRPLFALDLEALGDDVRGALAPGVRTVALRDAGALLPRDEAGLAAYAVALLNWHRRHRFCSNCGHATVIEEGGYSRRCPHCGTVQFPRTDPVVIMLVEHDGRLLLGRRSGWPGNRYSVLAGFVSPGESLEEAVVREVLEESGIMARDPRYVASQPWPFPSSLMLGFEARADGGEPRARDGELQDVRWFTRDAVRAAARGEGTGVELPPAVSIARFLIDGWLSREPG